MKKRITISKEHPGYWEYNGKPVVLLGGSVEDNIFQIPNLEEHLKLSYAAGGNYLRCTMSSRDEGNVWPYKKSGGLYDLNGFSDEYRKRFDNFLKLAYQLDIIVQIEVWDRFDFARSPWRLNPFNPKNNCNYTCGESLLKEEIKSHPNENESRFFFSIPEEDDNTLLLNYQEAFVDMLLAHTLDYPNILYCMDNETSAVEGWGRYWSEYIRKDAAAKGLEVHTTEMWDAWDIENEQHKRTFDHPETYSFCDISQNNHKCSDEHWEGIMKALEMVKSNKRPLNNVKIYGADGGPFGNEKDGIERFWRNILGKAASARFHRPPSGIGLSEKAQQNIKSARKLLKNIDIFKCVHGNDLLLGRCAGQTYCAANIPDEIVVYFCREGKQQVDVSGMKKDITVSRLDVNLNEWVYETKAAGSGQNKLEIYGKKNSIVLIK